MLGNRGGNINYIATPRAKCIADDLKNLGGFFYKRDEFLLSFRLLNLS